MKNDNKILIAFTNINSLQRISSDPNGLSINEKLKNFNQNNPFILIYDTKITSVSIESNDINFRNCNTILMYDYPTSEAQKDQYYNFLAKINNSFEQIYILYHENQSKLANEIITKFRDQNSNKILIKKDMHEKRIQSQYEILATIIENQQTRNE